MIFPVECFIFVSATYPIHHPHTPRVWYLRWLVKIAICTTYMSKFSKMNIDHGQQVELRETLLGFWYPLAATLLFLCYASMQVMRRRRETDNNNHNPLHNVSHHMKRDSVVIERNHERNKNKKCLPPHIYMNIFHLMKTVNRKGPQTWLDIFDSDEVKALNSDVIMITLVPYVILEALLYLLKPFFYLFGSNDIDTTMIPGTCIILIRDIVVARKILQNSSGVVYKGPRWFYKNHSLFAGKGNVSFSQEVGFRSEHVRKNLMMLFDHKNIDRFSDIILQHFKEWVNKTFIRGDDDRSNFEQPIFICDELPKIILRGIMSGMFDCSDEVVEEDLNMIIEAVASVWRFKTKATNIAILRNFSPEYKEVIRNTSKLRSFMKRLLRFKRRTRVDKKSAGKFSLDATNVVDRVLNDANYNDDEDRVSDLLVVMSASFDSCAYALVNVIIDLSKNSMEQRQLRNILQSLNIRDRPRSPALLNVLNESMRLHPIGASGVIRSSTNDLAIGDLIIPRKQFLMMNLWCLSLNESYFSDPKQFIPSRWNNMSEIAVSASIPYSYGPRSCLGKGLAVTTLKKCLAYLYSLQIELRLIEEGTWGLAQTYHTFGTIICAKNPMQ